MADKLSDCICSYESTQFKATFIEQWSSFFAYAEKYKYIKAKWMPVKYRCLTWIC